MKTIIAALLITFSLGLAACTGDQLAQAAMYHDLIQSACKEAMDFAPKVPDVAPWILGGCSTENDINRLAQDYTSFAWLKSLIVK